jgi:hypothetical protein
MCGCSGSTPRVAGARQTVTHHAAGSRERPARSGDFKWNGPKTRAAEPAAAPNGPAQQ